MVFDVIVVHGEDGVFKEAVVYDDDGVVFDYEYDVYDEDVVYDESGVYDEDVYDKKVMSLMMWI